MSKRNLSKLDYLKQLQIECIAYELRLKIYPNSEEKMKFKKVLKFKEEKIKDISSRNNLNNIFNNIDIRKETEAEFYDGFLNNDSLSKRDRYFYFWIGSDFSYEGRGVKLISYDLQSLTCKVKDYKNSVLELSLCSIKRIL